MSTEVRYPSDPRGLPAIGNTVDLSRDIFAFFEELCDEYGRIASYQVFGTDACMVAHPDVIQEVLLNDHESFKKGEVLTQNLADAMGEGLFVTGGNQWQNQRTQVQPAYLPESVEHVRP